MDDFVKQHGVAVFYIMSTIIVLLTSLLGYFLKWDRKKFMDGLEKNEKKIDAIKIEMTEEIVYVKKEIDGVKKNYNIKFDKVYSRIDDVKETINLNQIELIKAIHAIEMKIPGRL